jgi:hypothetical protein
MLNLVSLTLVNVEVNVPKSKYYTLAFRHHSADSRPLSSQPTPPSLRGKQLSAHLGPLPLSEVDWLRAFLNEPFLQYFNVLRSVSLLRINIHVFNTFWLFIRFIIGIF